MSYFSKKYVFLEKSQKSNLFMLALDRTLNPAVASGEFGFGLDDLEGAANFDSNILGQV